MSYTKFAWKGIANFFSTLDRVHATKPITWSTSSESELKMISRPRYLAWAVGNTVAFFVGMAIPVYILLEQIFGIHSRELSILQILVLVCMFFGTMHGVPIFLNYLRTGNDVRLGFNFLVLLEKHVRGNRIEWKRKTGQSVLNRVDIKGLVMNCLGPALLLIPFLTLILVYLEIDPGFHLVPETHRYSLLFVALRGGLFFWAMFELVTILGIHHMLLITLILHTKSIFTGLNYFKRQKVTLKTNWGNLASRTKQKIPSENAFVPFHDIQLFRLASYFFTVMNHNMDVAILFTLFPGFAIDVAVNYALLNIFDEVPIVVYAYVVLICILVPTIIAAELPQAGQSYVRSKELLHNWREGAMKRRTLRFKEVQSLRPLGYTMGGLFTFREGTTSTFCEQLVNYTINATLTI